MNLNATYGKLLLADDLQSSDISMDEWMFPGHRDTELNCRNGLSGYHGYDYIKSPGHAIFSGQTLSLLAGKIFPHRQAYLHRVECP